MAQAVFQVYNPDGSLHLSLADVTPRFLGTTTIGQSATSGNIYHSEFANGKAFCLPRSWPSNQPGGAPEFIFYSDRIYWSYKQSPQPVVIDYGVY